MEQHDLSDLIDESLKEESSDSGEDEHEGRFVGISHATTKLR